MIKFAFGVFIVGSQALDHFFPTLATKVAIFTAYGGPCAPREPGDATLSSDEEKKESADFWAQHALAAL